MIARIYKISGGGKFYIGSTTQTLNLRLKNHRSKSKEDSRKNTPLYKHFNEVGWENSIIELIHEQYFSDKKDLLEYEKTEIKKYQNNDNCLNYARPIRTIEEKIQQNKEYGKLHRKQHPEYHRQRLAEWRLCNVEKYKAQVIRSVVKQRNKRECILFESPPYIFQ